MTAHSRAGKWPLAVTIVERAPEAAPLVLRGPLDASVRNAARIGYDAVEVHLADRAELDLPALEVACRETGLVVSSLGTGLAAARDGLTLVHEDVAKRDAARTRMEAFVSLGARLGCVVIVGLVKGLARDAGGRDSYLARLRPEMERLVRQADREGVTLVFEAVNRYESDIFNTFAETLAFLGEFGSDRLKLHADTFHMNIEEVSMTEALRTAGPRLGHLHVADSNRRSPGQGHYDFSETLGVLDEIGYEGAVSLECLPWPSPDEAAESGFRFLKELA